MSESDPTPRLLGGVSLASASLVLLALIGTLLMGIAPNIDMRLVELGESLWPGYARDLRAGVPQKPDCDLAALEKQLAACPASAGASSPGSPAAGTGATGDAPAKSAAEPAPSADPFAGEDPFAEQAAPTQVSCTAVKNLCERCRERHEQYRSIVSRLTPWSQRFTWLELSISGLAQFAYWRHLLALVVLLGAITTTVGRMHIALRNPAHRLEHWVCQGAQLLAHGLLAASCFSDYAIQVSAQTSAKSPLLSALWGTGFTLLALVNVRHLLRPPAGLEGSTSLGRVLMVIPLYAYLVVISGSYFFAVSHPSGLAIHLAQFSQVPPVYLGVALYIWAGVLLSLTQVVGRMFDVLRPWQLPPALLGWLVVVLSALPTAYSGASGIYVMATGAVIFRELRASGASSRLALATTAMSGSLGVVLSPCLVVVLIATLNRQLTTAALFSHGKWVFALTSLLFLAAMLLRNDQKLRVAPLHAAGPASLRALWQLLPYGVLTAAVVLIYAGPLGTRLSEHTAAYVAPMLTLAMVFFDGWRSRRLPGAALQAAPLETAVPLAASAQAGVPLELGEDISASHTPNHMAHLANSAQVPHQRSREPGLSAPAPLPTVGPSGWRPGPLVLATEQASHHIGAILSLMAASVCLGGVVERSDLMSRVPASLGTPFLTMCILVAAMVLVGMTMDALGAVVLVSVSLAGIAYKNGIDPVHFWMMVLVAFELGYLTPPVAINFLLARQVIGEPAQLESQTAPTFWARYEHVLLPVLVMGTALLLVAFVPFLFYGS